MQVLLSIMIFGNVDHFVLGHKSAFFFRQCSDLLGYANHDLFIQVRLSFLMKQVLDQQMVGQPSQRQAPLIV